MASHCMDPWPERSIAETKPVGLWYWKPVPRVILIVRSIERTIFKTLFPMSNIHRLLLVMPPNAV